MDETLRGIILKTSDYKEADKLLTILTLEKGKIMVKARGVKKPSSKLKAFCQSFCFADFEVVESKGGYILSGVNQIESFFDLVLDIDKFSVGGKVLEVLDRICVENESYTALFVESLKALKTICYKEGKEKLALCKFLFELLNYEGFRLNLNKCSTCKSALVGDLFLDTKSGEVVCTACKTYDCVPLPRSDFSAIKILAQTDYDNLVTVKLSDKILDSTLNLLITNINLKFDIRLSQIK